MKIIFVFDRFSYDESQFYGGTNIRVKEILGLEKNIKFIKLAFNEKTVVKNKNIINISTMYSKKCKDYQEYISCKSKELIKKKLEFLRVILEYLKKEDKNSIIHLTGETYDLTKKLRNIGFKKIIYTYNVINCVQYFKPIFDSSSKEYSNFCLFTYKLTKNLFYDCLKFIKFLKAIYSAGLYKFLPIELKFPLLSDIYPMIYCDKVIFVSKNSLKTFGSVFNIKNTKCYVVYNGVNKIFYNKKKYTKIKKILAIGRIHPIKGFDILLNAILKLEQQRVLRDYKIIICGNIDSSQLKYYHYLKKLSERLINNKVIFTGLISQKKLSMLYKKNSLFISTALDEPFGMCILEAIASKNYIICSKTNGSLEFSKNAKIHLLKKNNDNILCRAIIDYINKEELEINQEVIHNQNFCKMFDWKISRKQLFKLYQNFL